MIAHDRGSQIADPRRSQKESFSYNRGQSQTIAELSFATFRSAEVSKLQALCACGKIASKQHGGHRGGNFDHYCYGGKRTHIVQLPP